MQVLPVGIGSPVGGCDGTGIAIDLVAPETTIMAAAPPTTQDTKLALLIASPWGSLRGPINDADLMEKELVKRDFEVLRCCGDDATQRGILAAWEALIARLPRPGQQASGGDVPVVIFYSGHGGLVKLPGGGGDDNRSAGSAREYQFIVPTDFDQSEDGFNGILDIQIAHLLSRTTERTKNVTVILDCCHAGRMARDPAHPNAVRKSLPAVAHWQLRAHVQPLHDQGQLRGQTHVNGNPHAVRVAAAATTETAWEYPDQTSSLSQVGALTSALVRALQESPVQDVSWRTTMLRVRELVNSEFPLQHPHVEGPSTRLLFSTETSDARPHTIQVRKGRAVIKAGRLAGVREGNAYLVMPPGFERATERDRLCRAKVLCVDAVESEAEIFEETGPIPFEGALAFLGNEALHQWTVSYSRDSGAESPHDQKKMPATGAKEVRRVRRRDRVVAWMAGLWEHAHMHRAPTPASVSNHEGVFQKEAQELDEEVKKAEQDLLQRLGSSKFVRRSSSRGFENPLVQITLETETGTFRARNRSNHLLASATGAIAAQRMVESAEALARGHHLLTLEGGGDSEGLRNAVRVVVRLAHLGGQNPEQHLPDDGSAVISEGQRIYISLCNRWDKAVWVTVFNVDATGCVSLISASGETGVRIAPEGSAGIPDDFGRRPGLKVTWPASWPRGGQVSETMIFIVTSVPVDLRHFRDHHAATGRAAAANDSELQFLVRHLATGLGRPVEADRSAVAYHVVRFPFEISPGDAR